MNCIICIVLYALWSMHCITFIVCLSIVLFALYYSPCRICVVFFVLNYLHCVLCIVLYAVYSMHCILCLYAYYSLHFSLYIVSLKSSLCIVLYASLTNFETCWRQTSQPSERQTLSHKSCYRS